MINMGIKMLVKTFLLDLNQEYENMFLLMKHNANELSQSVVFMLETQKEFYYIKFFKTILELVKEISNYQDLDGLDMIPNFIADFIYHELGFLELNGWTPREEEEYTFAVHEIAYDLADIIYQDVVNIVDMLLRHEEINNLLITNLELISANHFGQTLVACITSNKF